jgi:hypothetical protein
MAMIDVTDKQLTALRAVLNASDDLCNCVIASDVGSMRRALALAGALTELKRQGFLKDVK